MSKIISKVVNAVKKVVVYVRGDYAKGVAFIRSKQVVTRSMVVQFLMGIGKTESAAQATATVLLSPRQEDSKRGKLGNSLGNMSADGINYYMIPLKREKGVEKKFRFHLCTPAEVAVRTALAAKRVMPKSRKATAKKVKVVKAVKVVAKATPKKVAKKAKKPTIKPVVQEKTQVPVAPVAPAVETPAPAATVEASVTSTPDTNTTPIV